MAEWDEDFLTGLYDLRQLFGDKWAPAIIVALAGGTMRRVDILSTLNSYPLGENGSTKHAVVHDSILTRTLKKMTEEGLVVRTEREDTFPPEVYYSLNPAIMELMRAVEPAVEWARRHPDLIAAARVYGRERSESPHHTG